MEESIFQDCYNSWITQGEGIPFWGKLAEKYEYASGEILRCAFRRERKKRGITKKGYVKEDNSKDKPNILLFDLETSPLLVFTWGLWQQNIYPSAIVQDWHFLSFGAKWLFDNEIFSNVLTSKEAKSHDDKRVTKILWDFLDKADFVIAHNAKLFDVPRMNTRFLFHGLKPPSHYHIIDTLAIIKSTFDFSSNRLGAVNDFLGLLSKGDTDFQLWRDCFFGQQEALDKMEKYNRQDVLVLEDLYVRIRPWIKSHPNWSLYVDTDESVCRNCGSTKLEWKGYYTTPAGKYRSFRCECGAIGRARQNILNKSKRKSVTA